MLKFRLDLPWMTAGNFKRVIINPCLTGQKPDKTAQTEDQPLGEDPPRVEEPVEGAVGGKQVVRADVHNYQLEDKEEEEEEEQEQEQEEDKEEELEVTADKKDDPDYDEYIQEQVSKGNIRMRKVKTFQAGNIFFKRVENSKCFSVVDVARNQRDHCHNKSTEGFGHCNLCGAGGRRRGLG